MRQREALGGRLVDLRRLARNKKKYDVGPGAAPGSTSKVRPNATKSDC